MVKKNLIRIGEYIGYIMNPLVMGLIFFLLIFPIGIVSNLLGRDELKIKSYNTATFWVVVKKEFNFNFFRKQY